MGYNNNKVMIFHFKLFDW